MNQQACQLFPPANLGKSAVKVVMEPQLLPDKLGKELAEVTAEPGDPPYNITFMDVDMRSELSPLSNLLTS